MCRFHSGVNMNLESDMQTRQRRWHGQLEGALSQAGAGVDAVDFADEEDEDDDDISDFGGWRARAAEAVRRGGDDIEAAASSHGVVRTVLRQGDDQNYPLVGDEVAVHYVGKLAANGTKFDSSLDRGTPLIFNVGLGMVIRGWEFGVLQMSLGESSELAVPAALAYGAQGVPGKVPPNADLTFEVELLAINGLRSPGFRRHVWCSVL